MGASLGTRLGAVEGTALEAREGLVLGAVLGRPRGDARDGDSDGLGLVLLGAATRGGLEGDLVGSERGGFDNPVVVSAVGKDVVVVLAVWVGFFSVFSFAILLLLLLLVVVRVRYDHNRWRPVCPFRTRNARFVFPLLKNSNDDAASGAVPTGVFLFRCFVLMLVGVALGGIPKRGNS